MTNRYSCVVTLLYVSKVISEILECWIVLPINVSGSCLCKRARTSAGGDLGIRVGGDDGHGIRD